MLSTARPGFGPQLEIVIEYIAQYDILTFPASASARQDLAIGVDDAVGMAGITKLSERYQGLRLEFFTSPVPQSGIYDGYFLVGKGLGVIPALVLAPEGGDGEEYI